jgi:hypothetical protein
MVGIAPPSAALHCEAMPRGSAPPPDAPDQDRMVGIAQRCRANPRSADARRHDSQQAKRISLDRSAPRLGRRTGRGFLKVKRAARAANAGEAASGSVKCHHTFETREPPLELLTGEACRELRAKRAGRERGPRRERPDRGGPKKLERCE